MQDSSSDAFRSLHRCRPRRETRLSDRSFCPCRGVPPRWGVSAQSLLRHRLRSGRGGAYSATPMTNVEQQPEAKADHRPRVARMRRQRQREHILSVVRERYPGPGDTAVSLDDIIKAAAISKGTFYKYFLSLEDAVSQLGAELARQMILDMDVVYSPLKSPLDRVAMGCQLFLYRGVSDRGWAAFISHIQDLPQDSPLLQDILKDLGDGKAKNQFRIVSADTTAWIVIGVTFAALKQISLGRASRQFVRETVTLLLRGLGVSEARLLRALDKTEAVLFERGPAHFAWWAAG